MHGRVSADGREAVIDLRVLAGASDDPGVDVRAVVDTGFTGDLALPAELVSSLSLPERGFVEAELADGTTAALRLHDARILWFGRPLRVLVCQVDGAALVGMSLLRDSILTMDIVPSGQVTIVEHGWPD